MWRQSHHLALQLYRITDGFPRHEIFGITSQIRRAATSIPTNLAEACGRSGDRDFGRFVRIAMGSASQVDYPILLVSDLGYLRPEDHTELSAQLNEIRRMSTGLDKRLHRRFRNRVGDRTLTAKS